MFLLQLKYINLFLYLISIFRCFVFLYLLNFCQSSALTDHCHIICSLCICEFTNYFLLPQSGIYVSLSLCSMARPALTSKFYMFIQSVALLCWGNAKGPCYCLCFLFSHSHSPSLTLFLSHTVPPSCSLVGCLVYLLKYYQIFISLGAMQTEMKCK